MKQHKIYFDRSILSSEYIESKQNFNFIVTNATVNQNKRLISPWFYGAIGLSSVLLLSGLSVVKKEKINEEIVTIQQNQNLKQL